MSAISGIFERRGKPCSDDALSASLECLDDYGGGESGKWISGSIALGHRQTRIFFGEKNERFPLFDFSAGLTVTADARLDNRSELAAALGIRKSEAETISSGRLLLAAWQKWGRECVYHVVGDYAFAVWDERQNILFCARDHVGARPFYYSLTAERFVFASDIKAVKAFPNISDRLDEDYVKAFLDDHVFCKDRTYFAEIRALAPGHTLTVGANSEKSERFWLPENAPDIRLSNDAEYAEAAKEIYIRAVRDRMRTIENVGVHLSGGLDSSSVTILAARERKRQNLLPPVVYSWQPEPTEHSKNLLEYQLLDSVCRQENLTARHCPANVEDFLSVLKKDPALEPVSGTLANEITVQRQAAADNVRLIISGWGGDETLSFNGRGYYNDLLLRGRWRQFLLESRNFRSPAKFIAAQIFLLFFSDRNKGLDKLNARSLRFKASKNSFLRPEFQRNLKLKNPPSRDLGTRATLLDLWEMGFHSERMNSWTAHGAAFGVTYVYPLLDRRLMEFVVGLPPEQFMRGKTHRRIMRRATADFLPEQVCRNENKDDVVEVERSIVALNQAFELICRQILKTDKLSSRADFLDMPELMKYLQPNTAELQPDWIKNGRPRQPQIRRALQFLDF